MSEGEITWRDAVSGAVARFVTAGSDSAEREVRWIFEVATGADEDTEFDATLEEPVTVRRLARFDSMVERRLAGEPLQYVLGRWGFRNLDLLVDRRVLIPRPETEQVTDFALTEVDRLVTELGASYDNRLVVADLGTGSGAIGLAIATERTHVDVWATDISDEAVAVARANLAGIGRAGARVRLAVGDWFAALPNDLAGRVSVIVSNPPYVHPDDDLPPEVRDWEPADALFGGPTGRDALDRVVSEAPAWLVPGGALVVELAPQQAHAVAEFSLTCGFATAEVRHDLAGRARAVVARVPRAHA